MTKPDQRSPDLKLIMFARYTASSGITCSGSVACWARRWHDDDDDDDNDNNDDPQVAYALLFSFLVWNVDSVVGRRVFLVGALTFYIGQALKELLR